MTKKFPDYEMIMLLIYSKLGDKSVIGSMRLKVRNMYYMNFFLNSLNILLYM